MFAATAGSTHNDSNVTCWVSARDCRRYCNRWGYGRRDSDDCRFNLPDRRNHAPLPCAFQRNVQKLRSHLSGDLLFLQRLDFRSRAVRRRACFRYLVRWCATIIGLSKVHKTEGWRAAVAVLLPIFVCVGVVVVVYVAIFAAIVSSLHHANT